MDRAYYAAPLARFAATAPDEILGTLASRHPFALEGMQRLAWQYQVKHLQPLAACLPQGHLFMEFAIPRMGKRADVVIAHAGLIFVLEYKVGSKSFDRHARDQVLDYALDLKNFHAGSHARTIIPILIASEAETSRQPDGWFKDKVAAPVCATPEHALDVIRSVSSKATEETFNALNTLQAYADDCRSGQGALSRPRGGRDFPLRGRRAELVAHR